MNKSLEFVKPSVRAMTAYQLREHTAAVKLNQNENPYDIPDAFKDEILAAVRAQAWNRYPEFTNQTLIGRLADFLRVAPESILVGNGSNELLQTVVSTVLCRGKRLLLVTPTFAVYTQLGLVAEAGIDQIEFETDWSFPTDRVVAALQENDYALCIFCSPNSPTGSALPEGALLEILRTTRCPVVVDEAYQEFSRTTFVHLLQDHANLILTRTFSKALGMAGLRIGYLLASPTMTREFAKAKLPYNLNIFSQVAAEKLLQEPELVDAVIAEILAEKQRLMLALERVDGLQVFPSQANFLMIATQLPGSELFERLLQHGVLVRDISKSHPRLQNHLRLSVGTPTENDDLIQALHSIMKGYHGKG